MMLYWVAVAAAVVFGFLVLRAIRAGALAEALALGWLVGGLIVILLALVPGWLDTLAEAFDVADPPNLLLGVAFYVLMVMMLHVQIHISRLTRRQNRLIQETALARLDGDHPGA
jgi:hypothetical protein